MEESDWFNMWMRKEFPYKELLIGDILHWFDTTKQKLVWKTQVVRVERYPYSDKQKIFDRYSNSLGSQYYESRPDQGYFLGYKVRVEKKVGRSKPSNFRFPQLGWLRVDSEVTRNWIGSTRSEDIGSLDDYAPGNKKTLWEMLLEIDKKMQDVSPERIEGLVARTLRKDSRIVALLKKANDYTCQFPGCGKRIIKKSGGYYIEVAHVKPVAQDGQSVLGNLVVLCPNHHKEFDFGDLRIEEQSKVKLAGRLDGMGFEIALKF